MKSNCISLEVIKRLEDQTSYLFNETQLLHQLVKEQKSEFGEFQNKVLTEIEAFRSLHLRDQLEFLNGSITQTVTSQFNSLAFDYTQLQIQVANLSENLKVLYERVDSKLNRPFPGEILKQSADVNLIEYQKMLDRVEWLAGEFERSNERNLREQEEYRKALDNLSIQLESALSNQVSNLREGYTSQLQDIRVYLNTLSSIDSHKNMNVRNCAEENPAQVTEMELERCPSEAEGHYSEDDDKKQCEVLHNLAMQLKKLKQVCHSPRNNDMGKLDADFDNGKDQGNFRKPLSIPWNGKILSPSIKQLRECCGNLALIEAKYGSRLMKENERSFKLRFIWKNWIIWPTAQQLEMAQGDLNRLVALCPNKQPIQSNNSFRTKSHLSVLDGDPSVGI